ncbi:hypothetical protein EEZ25_29415 [Micromonospora aurantiaca]|uniref:hypothetical protein n=1 Tax=Micromonospora TaxID=1873 RepID=UPI000F41256B|nr:MULTISPECIES: hypothetical protein [Micromonospora]MCT2281034.1 hypothetical protein [Micromonospora chalcea]RNH97729.1 hypothetical protein EEZ25_29415 [Micromonospora aurantiaca]
MTISASPPGIELDTEERERISGFHRIADGPSVRIATGSLLALPARVASVHELVHQFLTERTTFGHLMLICSVLGRAVPGVAEHAVNLRRLAAQCRTTHESLATFESIWMAADGDRSVLAVSREYLSWYKDASETVPFADHTRLKLLAVQRVSHACMRGPVLENLVRVGPGDPDAWRVPPLDRPDRRLALFHRGLPADFWSEIWRECRDLLGEDVWVVFAPEAPSADLLTETFERHFDPVVSQLASYLDQRIEGLLDRQGARTAETSGAILRAAMETVKEAVPASRQRMRVSEDRTVPEGYTLEHVFRERILLSDERRPARLLSLAENLDMPFVRTTDKHLPPFVYMVVRSASRLLDQYAFPAADHERLVGYGDTVLTVVPVAPPSPAGEWLLLEIRQPREAEFLAEQLNGRAELHVNWSLASMAAATRRDRDARSPALATAARAIALADIRLALVDHPIVAVLHGWMRQNVSVRYASAIVQVSGTDRLCVVAFRVDEREDLVIVLWGGHQEEALRLFFDSHYPRAVWDPAVLPADAGHTTLRTMSLLLESEHVIDYRALLKP